MRIRSTYPLIAACALSIVSLACGMGDPSWPTLSPAEMTQMADLAQARATDFAQNGVKSFELDSPRFYTYDIAFSPVDRLFAWAGVNAWDEQISENYTRMIEDDPTVELWDLNNRKKVFTLEANSGPISIRGMAFTPDGNTLAIYVCQKINNVNETCEIHFWDIHSQQIILPSIPASTKGGFITFSPDGKILAMTKERAIGLWDVSSRRQVGTLTKDSVIFYARVTFSPNGKLIAAITGPEVTLWDSASYELYGSLKPSVQDLSINDAVFSPDSRRIYALADYSDCIFGWDVSLMQEITVGCIENSGLDLEMSPDGRWLAVTGDDNNVLLFDFQVNKFKSIPLTSTLDSGGVDQIDFSADSKLLAVKNFVPVDYVVLFLEIPE